MENNKHIFLTMDSEQKLYRNDVRYLLNFDGVKYSCGTNGEFYYDKETRCVVVAPYEDTGYFKTLFIDAHVESGDDIYRDSDTLELYISSSCEDESRKEFYATGEAVYGANYLSLDPDVAWIEEFVVKPKIRLDASCLIGVPPTGATIFIEVVPGFGNNEDFVDYANYEKTIATAYATVIMIGETKRE